MRGDWLFYKTADNAATRALCSLQFFISFFSFPMKKFYVILFTFLLHIIFYNLISTYRIFVYVWLVILWRKQYRHEYSIHLFSSWSLPRTQHKVRENELVLKFVKQDYWIISAGYSGILYICEKRKSNCMIMQIDYWAPASRDAYQQLLFPF